MASPIKETPVLHGNDAKRFRKEMAQTEKRGPNTAERARIEESYEKFKKLCPNFNGF